MRYENKPIYKNSYLMKFACPVWLRSLPLFVSLVVFPSCQKGTQIHVSPTGDDAADGSKAHPFATLERAKTAARIASKKPVTVWLAGGDYHFEKPFELSKEDSGTAQHPIIYRAADGQSPRLAGGKQLPSSSFKPITRAITLSRVAPTARGKILALDLKAHGVIHSRRYPDVFTDAGGIVDLFYNGKRMTISRFPNEGWMTFKSVIHTAGGPQGKDWNNPEKIQKVAPGSTGGIFEYRDEFHAKHALWKTQLNRGVWFRGYWRVAWDNSALRVLDINDSARTATFAKPINQGIGNKYNRPKGNGREAYQIINLLEEIDEPSEWCLDFKDQMIYFYPPAPLDTSEIILVDREAPVISLNGASHIVLRGRTVEFNLGDGIRVEGGEGVLVAGCRVTHVSRDGIVLKGGTGHTIQSCDTAETGYSGIAYLGGDRRTLTPSGHRIVNNIVSRAGLFYPAPGINGGLATKAEAVGNLIAHNRIHDCMNSGVVYGGNDNIFEYNEIYRVGLGSSDLGCFYTNAGWTSRGNIIRHNLVHNSMNANAFYVDDGDCGDTFFNNVAYKTRTGPFIGGGQDQTFVNNIIVESPIAVHIDARGIPRGYTVNDKRLRADLDSVPHGQPPWSEKYPLIAGILDSATERPARIVVEDNLLVACGKPLRKSDGGWEAGGGDAFEGLSFIGNVVSNDLAMFVNPENLDFRLKEDAPVFQDLPDFPQFPTAKIGPQPDEYRTQIPARDMEQLRNESTEGGFDSQTDVDASNRR